MSWVDKNKGAGPWPFTEQLDKWGYLNNPRWTDEPGPPVNYTGREDEEPQIWDIGDQNSHNFAKNEFSKDHKPCGHWHKKPVALPPPPPGDTPEIYWELLNSQPAQPYIIDNNDIMGLESFVKLDVSDFDGDVTWAWEVIGFNDYEFDITVQVVDDFGNVCGETVFVAGTVGSTGYELFRQRVDFTPSYSFEDRSYGIRVTKADGNYILTYPLRFFLTTARIVIIQENATKTKIQIPLMGDMCNYAMQSDGYSGGDYYPYSLPVARVLGDSDVSDFTDIWGGGSSNYFTTIWKYAKSELETVSKVVFSAVAKSQTPPLGAPYTKTLYIYSTPVVESFYMMLYRCPSGSPTGTCSSSTPGWGPEDQVYVDGCTGTTFTPIPDSLIEWNFVHEDDDPYPYNITVYPDFRGLTGHFNFHIGGDLHLYGENPGPWAQFGKWFSLNIPAGTGIVDAELTVESVDDPQDEHCRQKWTFKYKRSREADPLDLTLALWNMTDDCLVNGSELVWHKGEDWSRKEAEISLSEFKSVCEYELVLKCPDFVYSVTPIGREPEICDAQLWLNIDPISKLTIWQRCARTYEGNHDNNYIPNSWGADYWGGSLGANSIGCRVKLALPTGAIIYYEQTAYDKENYGGEVIEDLYCTILEDLGVDGNDGVSGVDVVDGKLIWDPAIYYQKRTRLRTGPLSLIDGNCYGVRSPDIDYYTILHNNGFIVISVKFS